VRRDPRRSGRDPEPRGGGPVERPDGWYAILDHVRQLGKKDLKLATGLGDRLGADTPLGDYALAHLAAALGIGKEES